MLQDQAGIFTNRILVVVDGHGDRFFRPYERHDGGMFIKIEHIKRVPGYFHGASAQKVWTVHDRNRAVHVLINPVGGAAPGMRHLPVAYRVMANLRTTVIAPPASSKRFGGRRTTRWGRSRALRKPPDRL